MKVIIVQEGIWKVGQELTLPLDYAESLIKQGIAEEVKDVKTNKSKPKPNNAIGSESVVEGAE